MKKFIHLFFLSVFLTVTVPEILLSQTLVDMVMQDTTGQPTLNFPFQAACKADGGNSIIIVGNTLSTTGNNAILFMKYNSTADTIVWQEQFSFPSDSNGGYGIDVFALGNYFYLAASQTGTYTGGGVFKFNSSTGAVIWEQDFFDTTGNYLVPTAVTADSNGNVYLALTQQTAPTQSEMMLSKMDSNGNILYTSYYDTTGMITGATALALPTDGKTDLIVTGFSGTGFGAWDFVTANFDINTGDFDGVTFSSNGDGSFSSPAGIGKDYSDRTYISGTAVDGSATHIKTIGYDSVFNQRWVKFWGNADSLPDSASRMNMDANANILITGYTTADNGAKQLLVLKYNTAGTLIFSRTIAAPNPAYNCVGNDITADDSLNVYVTGYFYNGSTNSNDFITIAFDKNGNTLWEKTYDGGGTNDIANDIVLDDNNNVWVSGISSSGATATYLTLEYQTKTYTVTTVNDTSGNPLYVRGNVIVRFAPNVLDTDFINNSGLVYGALNQVLKSSFYSTLVSDFEKDYPDVDITDAYLVKLAPNYRTWNNYLISNLGDTVIIPPFWSSFLMAFTSRTATEQQVANELKTTYPNVKYAHLNLVGYYASCDSGGACDSVTPTDDFYCSKQFAINSNDTAAYSNGQLNTEAAWAIETGKPFVKVGILDGDVWYLHPDFLTDSATNTSKVEGFDYGNGQIAFTQLPPLSSHFDSHGTSVAGIIGALRNNDKGIAGVAGGNWCGNVTTENSGASLYSFGVADGIIVNDGSPVANLLMSLVVQAMNDAINNDTTKPFSNMDILNCSIAFYPAMDSDSIADFPELKEKYYMAFRMGKIVVAARGEDNFGAGILSGNLTAYPACYPDDWLLTVGGSNEHGDYGGGYYNNIDVIAPYPSEMTYTTTLWSDEEYGTFNATSAAAPYVTGLVALIKSYLDDPGGPDSINVAPEDAEQIIQRTAWFDVENVYTPPYDPYIGWGRVDMGKAMQMIDKSHNRLLHFNSLTSPTTNSISEVASDINLTLLDDVPNLAVVPTLSAGNYKASVFRLNEFVDYKPLLLSGENIEANWARPSASNSYPLYTVVDSVNNTLEPYEQDSITPVTTISNDSTASLWGYFYLMMTTWGDTLGWIPQNPFIYDGVPPVFLPKMSFTVYISSDSLIPTYIKTIKNTLTVSVFPNPTDNQFHFNLNAPEPELFTVQLFNSLGQSVKTLFTGQTAYLSNDYDVSEYEAGIYYIRVSSSKQFKMIKLVIAK